MTTVGFTAQQNVAQAQLVNSAATLAKALSEYYSDQGQIANATNQEMSTSDWRRLREQMLLNKALALKSELTPLTTGTPAPGDDYGITTATVTALGALVAGFGRDRAAWRAAFEPESRDDCRPWPGRSGHAAGPAQSVSEFDFI